jgi:hypothetical protein
MKRDTERELTLEDLLRLKKAERPPAEFWAGFEAELRTKQLAAIVGRRPWWDGASRLFAIGRRHSVSVGALAAVALAVVGVRHMGTPAQSVLVVSAGKVQAAVAAAPLRLAPVSAPQTVADVPARAAAMPEPVPAPVVAAQASVSHVMQAPETVPPVAASREPFGDGFAVTLTDFHAAAPDLGQRDVFGSDREFESSASPARQQNSEPLSQMDPSAERRARLLAPALPAYAPSSRGALSRDWMKDRSSDDRMYESMDLNGSSDRAVVGFRF